MTCSFNQTQQSQIKHCILYCVYVVSEYLKPAVKMKLSHSQAIDFLHLLQHTVFLKGEQSGRWTCSLKQNPAAEVHL